MKNKFKNIKKEEGFTIIELVIVLSIIIVIIAITTPNLIKYLDTARETADKATARTIATAVEMMRLDGNIEDVNTENLVKEKYLTKEPKPQKKGKSSFIIEIADEEIKIYYDEKNSGNQIYPEIESAND